MVSKLGFRRGKSSFEKGRQKKQQQQQHEQNDKEDMIPVRPPVIKIPTPKLSMPTETPKINNMTEMVVDADYPEYQRPRKNDDVSYIEPVVEGKSRSAPVANVDYDYGHSDSNGREGGHFNFDYYDTRGLEYDPTGRSPMNSPRYDVTFDTRDDVEYADDDHHHRASSGKDVHYHAIELVPTDLGDDTPRHIGGPTNNNLKSVASYASMTTSGTFQVPIFKVTDAENRLFDATLGYNVELRHAFEFPPDMFAEDVYVHLDTMLERGRGNPRRHELAASVKAVLRQEFGKKYPKKRRDGKEKLLLKVFVVDISEGDRETRMLAPECQIGLVRLCLAWVICSTDGNIVFDGGRVGMTDGLAMGVLDALHLTTGLSVLTGKCAPRLSRHIISRIDLKSNQSFFALPPLPW